MKMFTPDVLDTISRFDLQQCEKVIEAFGRYDVVHTLVHGIEAKQDAVMAKKLTEIAKFYMDADEE